MADTPTSSGVRDALRALRAGHRIVAMASPDERKAVVADIATIIEAVTGGLRREDQRRDLVDALSGVAAEMDVEDRRWPDHEEGAAPDEARDARHEPCAPGSAEAAEADRDRIERARARVDGAVGGNDG